MNDPKVVVTLSDNDPKVWGLGHTGLDGSGAGF